MPLSTAEQDNFDTLSQAIRHGDCLLLECQLVTSGQAVPVMCAVNRHDDGSQTLVPLAQMFTDNPYTTVNPPHPDRPGFATQEEVWQGDAS